MRFLFIVFMFNAAGAMAFDRLSLSTAAGRNQQQLSADASRFWQVGQSRLWLGTGVRATSQWGSSQNFQTAPARLTTGQSGPQVLFLENKDENIDDLRLGSSQVTSVNLVFQLLYQLNEDWGFGTNIDVIGGSFGKRQTGSYTPKSDSASYPNQVSARPSPFNLLLISDNDLGSLNSELYAHKNLGNGWGFKVAANFAFAEYKTSQKLRNDNDRFRKKALLPSIGITKDF